MNITWQLVDKFEARSVSEMERNYQRLASIFSEKTIVLFYGEVGVGKTESVRLIASTFGVKSETSSPSFALHNTYHSATGDYEIDHLDLYRLASEDELESSGFWDLFRKERGLILIEWSERLNQAWLPLDWNLLKIEISLSPSEPMTRRVEVSKRVGIG